MSFLPPLEMRPSSIATNPVESREAPPTPQRPSPLRGTLGSFLRSSGEVGGNEGLTLQPEKVRRDGEEEETVGRGGRGEGTVSDHIAHLARNFSGRPVTLLIMQTGRLVYTGRTLCPRAAGQPYLSRWLSRCTGSRDFSKNGSGRDFSKNGSGWASESGEIGRAHV